MFKVATTSESTASIPSSQSITLTTLESASTILTVSGANTDAVVRTVSSDGNTIVVTPGNVNETTTIQEVIIISPNSPIQQQQQQNQHQIHQIAPPQIQSQQTQQQQQQQQPQQNQSIALNSSGRDISSTGGVMTG